MALKHGYSRRSANDCSALVTTNCQKISVRLTGDNLLREVFSTPAVRVHGGLWIIDELHIAEV